MCGFSLKIIMKLNKRTLALALGLSLCVLGASIVGLQIRQFSSNSSSSFGTSVPKVEQSQGFDVHGRIKVSLEK